MQVTDWVSIYLAIINTAALGVAALIYTAWVRPKNAQIDNLQTQIELWKSQSIDAVHQRNKALKEEIEELFKEANREREQFQREKEELLKTIEELKTQREAPSETRWQRLQDLAGSRFDELIASPPSGQAADRLRQLILSPEPLIVKFSTLEPKVKYTGPDMFKPTESNEKEEE